MTVTADCGARNAWEYHVHVIAHTSYNTGSPTGATASNGNAGTNGALTLTLSGAPATDSEVVAALFKSNGGGGPGSNMTSAPGTGWTELYDTGEVDSGDEFQQSQIRGSSASTSVDWNDINDSTGTVSKSIAAALEIKAAAGGAAVPSSKIIQQAVHRAASY